MKLFKASLYTNKLWNSYKSDGQSKNDNVVFDKIINGKLDIKRLSKSISNLTNDSPFINRYLSEISGVLYWRESPNNIKLEIVKGKTDHLFFIQNNFNLETGPLVRFGIFKNSENNYELLMVMHYALINGATFDEFSDFLESINIKIKNYENLVSTTIFTSAIYNYKFLNRNSTNRAYPKNKTIHELFEKQVLKTPNNIALIFEGEQLNYSELNAKSNQLAHYIRSQNTIESDTIIALCLDKSLEMVIGILGILKAGAAYVPIDPKYPEQRIQYIIEDTQTKLVLTKTCFVEKLNKMLNVNLVSLDSPIYSKKEITNLPLHYKATDLAYVIYTSGTSGKAKGVVVEHRSAIYYMTLFNETTKITNSISGFTLNYTFDASLPTIFSSIISGGIVHVMKAIDSYDPIELVNYIKNNDINVIRFTPTILNHLSDQLFLFDQELTIVLGGEILNIDITNRLIKNNNLSLYNQYGPTECVVGSTVYPLNQNIALQNIGMGYSGKRIYVLDQENNHVSIGVVGELHIGGAGLARGYLHQPELTAEKFIFNPFANKEDLANGYTKMYKTGDLVRWLPDGNLEYIGRNDFQVKIRGFRIELGEIESTLVTIQGVKQACVLSKQKNGKDYLVGYFVAEKELSEAFILAELSRQLPHYMVPNIMVPLEELPLTINGKLDRKALPHPEFINESSYQEPTTDLEITLCSIWQDVLGLQKIGIVDDFFRIGGDSILSIQLSSRLRKHGINCNTKAIFDHRTIKSLAQFISSVDHQIETIAEQELLEGTFDLLPIQKWFFDKQDNKEFLRINHWNQSFLIKTPHLEKEKLPSVIKKLTQQHDVLRMVYRGNSQTYLSEIEIPELGYFNLEDQSASEFEDILTNWQSNFDIHTGPLWKIAYIEDTKNKSSRLYFAFHHLIIDTVSWRIIIDDFKTLYNGENLGEKSSSYRQWVNEVSAYEKNHPAEKAYWNELLNSIPRYELEKNKIELGTSSINKEVTHYLLHHANQAYHTEINDLLLTALGLTLQHWNNNSRQIITLEGHGRETLSDSIDLSKTMGWFTTIYPVQLDLKKNIGSSIKSIKENLRAIPNKGIGFGAIYPKEQLNLPAISFNYLGQFDSSDRYWHVVPEYSGVSVHNKNYDSTIININGSIIEGCLNFRVATRLGKTETLEFSQTFQQQLEQVIIHCKNQIERNTTRYTSSDFKTVTISQSLLDKIQNEKQIEAIHLANSLQQGFIYHALSQPKDDAYRVQILLDYNQGLNIDTYVQSWQLAIEKYPILRTAFNWEEEMIQIVYLQAKLNYEILDISHLTENDQKEYIHKLQQKDRNIAFDLTIPCLLRLYIIKQSENQYVLLKSEHHSISDGWSEPILLNTVHGYYEELQQHKSVKVIPDTSYLDAQDYISKHQIELGRYWKKVMVSHQQTNDLNPLLSKKQDLDALNSLTKDYDTLLEITGESYSKLKALTKSIGVTLNSIVQFAWHKLIQIYTQDLQTTVGTTVSGRAIPVTGIEKSVGLYINTLPLIIDWDNNNTVRQQIQYIHQQITNLNSNSFVNLASLQKEGQRLFHSLFVFENYPNPKGSNNGNPNRLTSTFRYAVEKLNYPLALTVYERDHRLILKLKSDKTLLSQDKANYNLEKLQFILNGLNTKLDKKHHELSTLTSKEYQQIVVDWNKTDQHYPKDKTIHAIFEEQVLRTPNNIALVFEDQKISYSELNAKSNQLARFLRAQIKIKPDTLIALCLDRNLDTIIGILGILKAGAAYVPIDPATPQDRIDNLFQNSNFCAILTFRKFQNIFLAAENIIICLDDIRETLIDIGISNLKIEVNNNHLAYVMHTSGTTGIPNGIMIEHQGVIRLVKNQSYVVLDENTVMLQCAPIFFDASTFEIYGALLNGGTLIIYPFKMIDLTELNQVIHQKKVTTLWLTAALFEKWAQSVDENSSAIKYLLTGGDVVAPYAVKQVYDKCPNIIIINGYGPTENTTFTTTHKIGRNSNKQETIPIGKPIENTQVYVLDKNERIVPVGVIGELYTSGAGIARGYLNQSEFTEQKFRNNHFVSYQDSTKTSTKMYKTGDLVRWLPNGNLEYIGRNDFQVKIRGFRIELSEIERALIAIQGIKQVCVLAKENKGNKYLVAYLLADYKLLENNILVKLSEQFPNYMLPSIFVQLENFPLTINGKLDRQAFPEPTFTNELDYLEPKTDIEIKLCVIWQNVLGLDKIGISADFFQLGGNSISAMKLSHQISKEFDEEIAIGDVFKFSTIAQIATLIEKNEQKETNQNIIWEI